MVDVRRLPVLPARRLLHKLLELGELLIAEGPQVQRRRARVVRVLHRQPIRPAPVRRVLPLQVRRSGRVVGEAPGSCRPKHGEARRSGRSAAVSSLRNFRSVAWCAGRWSRRRTSSGGTERGKPALGAHFGRASALRRGGERASPTTRRGPTSPTSREETPKYRAAAFQSSRIAFRTYAAAATRASPFGARSRLVELALGCFLVCGLV